VLLKHSRHFYEFARVGKLIAFLTDHDAFCHIFVC
jgi:hypothetical protein